MAWLKTILQLLCFSPMQTYYLCVTFLGLCATCLYFLVYTSTQVGSPLAPCTNGGLFGGNVSRSGFLMALDYSDQLTGGGMNLFCLQCLAHSIDPSLVVVEPFIVKSTFGASLDFRNPPFETPWKSNAIRLSDVYSIERWQQFSSKKCYAPLVPWETFLDSAPRSVVLVQHTWDGGCSLDRFQEKYSPFLMLYQFTIIRTVCFNFKTSGDLELWRYKYSIYGDLDPTNVTVIYQKWLGVGKDVTKYTVSISDSYCEKEATAGPLFNELHVFPSQKLWSDAEKYSSRFLGGAKNNNYIGVMLRIEQVFVSTSRRVNRLNLVSRCLDNLIKKWKYMTQQSGISKTFLAVDYGKYGSKGFGIHNYMNQESLEGKLESLLRTMGQGNLSAWETRFREVTGTENPGYIASLQQAIASRARCLVTAGGGSFQNHAFMLHKKMYGKTCHIRIKTNCKMFDNIIKLPSPALTTTAAPTST